MARLRSLFAAALNIRIHPHSQDLYISLFQDAFSLRKSIRIRGDQHLIISSISKNSIPITGTIARYTEIDTKLPWFNSEHFDEADDSDIRKINIPGELKPNYASFNFSFHPDQHLFIFEHKANNIYLSAQLAQRFMERLLNSAELQKKYKYASVDVLNDKEKLSQIISIKELRRLIIKVQRPNPDGLGDYDDDVEERLNEQNARQVTIVYDHIPGESLEPDENTKKVAEIAMENGKVEAFGKEDGKSVTRSSAEHPKIEVIKYDPELKTEDQAFSDAANNLAERLKNRRRTQ